MSKHSATGSHEPKKRMRYRKEKKKTGDTTSTAVVYDKCYEWGVVVGVGGGEGAVRKIGARNTL